MDAYVFLRTEPGQTRDVAEGLAALTDTGIRQAAVITGEWDVVVAIEVDDPYALGDTVMNAIHTRDGVAETQTLVAVPFPNPDDTGAPVKPMPTRGRFRFFAIVLAKVEASLAREHPRGWRAWGQSLADALHELPTVFAGTLVTGEWDLLIEVGGETWDECAAGILDIAALPGIAGTTTAVAVTPKLAGEAVTS